MARIYFKDQARKILTAETDAAAFSACTKSDLEHLSEPIRSVLVLYDHFLEQLSRCIACLLDQRLDDLEMHRRQCREVLVTLLQGLDRHEELGQNLYILYGHCLRRLGEDGARLKAEELDGVKMVILRLKRVYLHLARRNREEREPPPDRDQGGPT